MNKFLKLVNETPAIDTENPQNNTENIEWDIETAIKLANIDYKNYFHTRKSNKFLITRGDDLQITIMIKPKNIIEMYTNYEKNDKEIIEWLKEYETACKQIKEYIEKCLKYPLMKKNKKRNFKDFLK